MLTHYYLNQHDLAKIFKGIQAYPDLCSSALSVAKVSLNRALIEP
jgi:hypothetical protein